MPIHASYVRARTPLTVHPHCARRARVHMPQGVADSNANNRVLTDDAMSVVYEYGKQTLFITFTANPRWPEVAVHDVHAHHHNAASCARTLTSYIRK